MDNILDYSGKQVKNVLHDFRTIFEEHRSFEEISEYCIVTDSLEVQGALLRLIDDLELDHRIELGGKIYVTVG